MMLNVSDVWGLVVILLFPRVPFVTGDILDDAVSHALRDMFVCGEDIAIPDFNITQLSVYL